MRGAVQDCDADEIVGESAAIRKMLRDVERVAPTGATVLILGETGTGKELVARAIHQLSPRRERALVKLNCSAIPSGLIESELFGHEKGAFTGAHARKLGRFEQADGGTILLDEIGDLQPDMQTKLLRVLQEEEFERVGGTETIRVNVRVVAATNVDVHEAMREGRFRLDLYYRLSVFPVHVPPLRERPGDIRPLAAHFVDKHCARLGRTTERIPRETLDALEAYSWPGNVRQLENVVERALILSDGLGLSLPAPWPPSPPVQPGEQPICTLEEQERRHILKALERTRWRVSGERGAASLLGVKPTTLNARMKRLGIHRG